jgi:phenylacetate-CoA ligase
VIATIRELGPDHRFVVLGYPPFLKDVADDPRIDLADYDVVAGFGGEGLSENMRDHLLRSYRRVLGSYGASDLEINLAAETPFTIALRRALLADAALRSALLDRPDGPTPMVFQCNPLDYVLETNDAGELVVTVCRAVDLSPRIRYNIHDVAYVVRMPRLRRILRAHGRAGLAAAADTDLPVLFHHGRADASIDFYGAVVGPDDLREALYAQPALANRLRRFRLLTWEDATAAPRLDLAVELQPGRTADDLDVGALGASVLAAMGRRNPDFANACRIAAAAPRLRVVPAGTDLFRAADGLKHRHVDHVGHDPVGT